MNIRLGHLPSHLGNIPLITGREMDHRPAALTPSSLHINSVIEVWNGWKIERTESTEKGRKVIEKKEREELGMKTERDKGYLEKRNVSETWLRSLVSSHSPVFSFSLAREPSYYFRVKTIFHTPLAAKDDLVTKYLPRKLKRKLMKVWNLLQ